MSKPKIFKSLSGAEKREATQKLSTLQNLGPVLEKVLNSVGICTVDDLKRVGWQLVISRLLKKSSRYLFPIYSYVLIGALSNQVWNAIPESEKIKAKKFVKDLVHKIKPRKRKAPLKKARLKKRKI